MSSSAAPHFVATRMQAKVDMQQKKRAESWLHREVGDVVWEILRYLPARKTVGCIGL
jgi:hypothetical protein